MSGIINPNGLDPLLPGAINGGGLKRSGLLLLLQILFGRKPGLPFEKGIENRF